MHLARDLLRTFAIAPSDGQSEMRELSLMRIQFAGVLECGAKVLLRDAEVAVEKSLHPAIELLGRRGLRGRGLHGRARHLGGATGDSPVVAPLVAGRSTSLRPEVNGFLWGAGSMAALGLLLFLGYQKMQPKEAPVQPAAMQQAPPAAASQDDASLRNLEARVKSNPDDLALRLELTHAYLDKENLMGVFDQTDYILKKNPNDAQAQTYQALVRMAMGQRDSALTLLKSATTNDPSLLDAWVALAWYYAQVGNKSEARAAIDQAIKRHPDEKARLEAVWQQMGSKNPAAAPAASNDSITVTLNLASAKASASGVLFVIARPEGVTAGPPIAVKRIPAATFPITIDLSSADSMMGQPIPPKVRIEARLDADGNPLTKDPNEPKAVQDGVALGSKVSLTLK
jgi:cytochrome c-type biogenesis protein CcmH